MKKSGFKLITVLMVITIMATLFSGCSLSCTFGGHKWVKATCKTPKHCSVCNKTVGKTVAHSTTFGKCSVCGEFVTTDAYKLSNIQDDVDNILDQTTDGVDYLTSDYYSSATNAFYDVRDSLDSIITELDGSSAFDNLREEFEDARYYYNEAIDNIENAYYAEDFYTEYLYKKDGLSSLKTALTKMQTASDDYRVLAQEAKNHL